MFKKTPALLLLAGLLALLLLPGAAPAQSGGERHRGKVTTTMDSGGYTYIEFEESGKKLWAAAPPVKVKVGDTVELAGGMVMKNFTSQTLKKTFPEILFTASVTVGGSPAAGTATLPPGHIAVRPKTASAAVIAPGSIARAKDGRTVEECYSRKAELKGQTIFVRGQVVKFNPEILGFNWLHIQDGSGAKGTNDLTVTTKDKAAVGDVVLVSGTLVLDKDLGSGYAFPVLIEKAAVKVEPAAKR